MINETKVSGLSFATDLLFNSDAVIKKCTSDSIVSREVLAMLKARISLEQHYASELKRIAHSSLMATMVEGSMKDALTDLQSQYMNTSVQHEIFSRSLKEDVVTELENEMNKQTSIQIQLSAGIDSLHKAGTAMEDEYVKYANLLDYQFNKASTNFTDALKAGVSKKAIETRVQSILSSKQDLGALVKLPPKKIFGRKKKNKEFDSPNNNVKLVGWLLPSPGAEGKLTEAEVARTFAVAEGSRIKAHDSWRNLGVARRDQFLNVQNILTDFQKSSIELTSTLKSCLRKKVVYESELLANVQYDWQMLAGKFDLIDCTNDTRDFILSNRNMLDTVDMRELCKQCSKRALPHLELPLPPSEKSFTVNSILERVLPISTVAIPLHGFLVTGGYQANDDNEVLELVDIKRVKNAITVARQLTAQFDEQRACGNTAVRHE